jgi:hypothetical protein
MENFPVVTDNIKLTNFISLIKIHLYIKMIEKDIDVKNFSDRELTVLAELYSFGGVSSKESLSAFAEHCSLKKLSDNSVQSIRNILSKARSLQIVKRPKSNNWLIDKNFLFKIDSKKLIFKYTIHNIDL